MNFLKFFKILLTSVFFMIFSFVANANKEIKIGVIFDYTGPLAGGGSDLQALGVKIVSIEKNAGEDVNEDDTVIVLEAMKMETTVKTPIGGKILKFYVQNGDKVKSGDPLFEVLA